MMFRRKTDAQGPRRPSLMEELDRLKRRALAIPLAAPILLFGGWGLGKVTTDTLALPQQTATSGVSTSPRVQLEALRPFMEQLRDDGKSTANYVVMYRDHVEPVEKVLRRHGVPRSTARKIAWPVVQEAAKRDLDPATVVAVVLVESEGKPRATSPVGARGLMQVMPLWVGQLRGCRSKTVGDLYDIDTNICHGTSILAYYFKTYDGDTKRALLGYNGCVRGTNTPNCHRYPDKIYRLAAQIRREMNTMRSGPPAAAAP